MRLLLVLFTCVALGINGGGDVARATPDSAPATSIQDPSSSAGVRAATTVPVKLQGLQAPCLDVVWFGVRGSGETADKDLGMGRPVRVAFTGFLSKVSGRRVAYWPLSYPATAVTVALATAAGRKRYFAGIDTGIDALRNALRTRAARCPSEKYVVAGYSQGAMVVHRALFKIVRAWSGMPGARRFLGFVLIGDGDQLPGQKGLGLGTAGNGSGRSEGVSWVLPSAAGDRYKPVGDYIPAAVREATISVCDEDDIVCDFENLRWPPATTRVSIHTHRYHRFETANPAHTAGRIIGARTMRLTIQSQGLQVANPTPAPITAGTPYTWKFQAGGGVAPYTYSFAGFAYFNGYALGPDGTFSGSNDFDFGGSIEFTLRVTDARGQRIDRLIRITVLRPDDPPEPEPNDASLPAPQQWRSVSIDDMSACGVKLDGSGWCWGENASGTSSALPVELPGDRTWSSLEVGGSSGGGNDVCGIVVSSELLCWGSISHQSGFPTATAEEPRSFGAGWESASIGDEHACAVKTDGTAWCWGANDDGWSNPGAGRLGNGTDTSATTPVQVVGGSWASISAATTSTCGTRTNGSLWCWGGNGQGQLGTATEEDHSLVPLEVAANQSWTSVSVGGGYGGSTSAFACAIRTDGSAWCWGRPKNGLGNGATSSTVPVRVDDTTTWTTISSGDEHVCGVKSDGSAWCWGGNYAAQLGSGDTASQYRPRQVLGAGTWTAVDVGNSAGSSATATCGVKTDHTAWCWGDRSEGRLGNGTREYIALPAKIPGTGWSSLTLGTYHGCGVRTDHSGWCWGGRYGESLLGGSTQPDPSLVPVRIPGNAQWHSLSTRSTFTCGVQLNGSGWCWGGNDSIGGDTRGALGNGTTTDSYDPVTVQGTGAWTTITAGMQHACGLKADGTGWCWGVNRNGMLGADSDAAYLNVPTEVSGGYLWQDISAGDSATCGVRSGGTLWCWGDNTADRLGVESASARVPAPVQVGTDTSWTTVVVGSDEICALKQDASRWCWSGMTPSDLGSAVATSRPSGHTCAIAAGGVLTCRGHNGSGQLGGGTATPYDDGPETIVPGSWSSVTTVAGGTCATRPDGTAWCWGAREDGRIGNGTAWWQPVPSPVRG